MGVPDSVSTTPRPEDIIIAFDIFSRYPDVFFLSDCSSVGVVRLSLDPSGIVDGSRSAVEAATKAPSTALGFRLVGIVPAAVVAVAAVAGEVYS